MVLFRFRNGVGRTLASQFFRINHLIAKQKEMGRRETKRNGKINFNVIVDAAMIEGAVDATPSH